jgi:dihydroorotate dehydrogenase (NAD+) catalytic subunit
VVGLLKERLQKPIIPKLSPNIPNLVEIAQVCEDNGADALCLINTVGPGVATDMEGAPALTNVSGGLSGAGIFPLGLKAVRDVSQRAQIPIIACGGISGPAQIRAYYEAGAALFGVGSALAGLDTSEIVEFFKDISNDLQSEQESGIQVKLSPKTGLTNYFKTRVLETRSFGEGLFEIKLEDGPECKPGQFFFLRRPGIGEKPFSPAEDQPPLYLVRVVGQFTEALSKLRPGDAVFLRGPYGNGFPEPQSDRRLLLIGGGTGVAPLMMAAAKYRGDLKMSYAGFSSPVDRPFRYDLAGRLPYCKLIVDPPKELGAMAHGLARDMENDPGEFYKIQAFLSGPKPMVDQVASLLKKELTDPLIHVAREDIMRCGIGLCGSCATEDGRRSCVDGPVTAPYTE